MFKSVSLKSHPQVTFILADTTFIQPIHFPQSKDFLPLMITSSLVNTTKYSKRFQGFSLTEIVVALSCLGLIASLAIPALLTGVGTIQKKAIFKESLQILKENGNAYLLENTADISGTNDMASWTFKKMNATKDCSLNAPVGKRTLVTGGCVPATYTTLLKEGWWDTPETSPGVVLNNGAIISSPWMGGGATTVSVRFTIDYNGLALPNKFGEDVLMVDMFLGSNAKDASNHKIGELWGFCTGVSCTPNMALYDWINN